MTRARSGTPASPFHHRRHDKPRQHDHETHEADGDPPGDRLRVIAQLELPRARRYRNGQQRVVAAEHLARSPIEADGIARSGAGLIGALVGSNTTRSYPGSRGSARVGGTSESAESFTAAGTTRT